jgi:hypothetical protein
MALISDSFNRANGAVGTADVGGAWSTGGAPAIVSNQLSMASGDTIYINTSTSDVDMSVTWVSKGFISYGQILPRYVDGNNFVCVRDGDIGKMVAGAYSTVSTHSGTIAAGSVVRVVAVGSTIKVYDDGVLINTSTVSNFTTATRQGLRHDTGYGATWDTFSVSAVSAAGVADALIEVDVTNDPRSGVTTWTDITSYARGPITITRGRQDELGDQLAPATATLTLDNSDGRFTPDYTSGPYSAGFRKGIQVRVSVDLDGTTYRRFTGYVDEIDGPSWPGGVTQQSFVTLTCSDELAQWSKGRKFKDVLTETILRDDPDAYYPLTDGEKIDESGNDQKRLITESRNGGGSLNGMFNFTNPGLVRNVTRPNVPRDAVSRDIDPETTAQRNWRGGSFRFQQGWQGGHNYLAQDLTVTAASTKWAIECWARLQRDNDGNGGWLVYLKNGTRYLGVGYNSDGTARASVYDGTTVSNATAHRLTNNDWHHVFVHYDRAGDVELWIDGRQRATGTTQNWDNSTTTPTLWVGSGLYAGASTYYGIQKGNVAHVAVYTGTNADDALTNVADHYEAGWSGFQDARTGEMLDRLVGWMKFPGTTNFDNGLSTVGDGFAEGSTALDYAQLLIDSEAGSLFTKGNGNIVFHQRSYRFNNTTDVFDINTYHDPSTAFRTDDQYLVNRARYRLANGGRGIANSAASVADYGPYEREVETLLRNEYAAEDLAKFAVFRGKDPTARLIAFPLDLLTAPLTTSVDALNVQIDDRVKMTNLPSQAKSTTVRGFVEGWTETIGTPEQNVWTITFNTSPTYTISDYFILNDATQGQLNQEKLYY